ncbi:hypothetical protein G9A89_006756 [Geosiphon pyriformis]|nr:hypothetical protein G9A89_006756 [Geosiphon pyriformis]
MTDQTENSTSQLVFPEITKSHKAPYLSHISLILLTHLGEWVPGLSKILFHNSGLTSLRSLNFEERPTLIPLPLPKEKFGVTETLIQGLEIFDQKSSSYDQNGSTGFLTVWHLREAYLNAKTTPLKVAEDLLQKIEIAHNSTQSYTSLGGFHIYDREDILKQAEASATRYAQRKSLGPLDGIPIGIKDEIDVKGYETRVGTSFINLGHKAQRDAFVVERLREHGAIILGKTNMHEFGLDITGNNPVAITPRNPYNQKHYCGGSSGGSAAIVAAGLSPIAIGCDGGGSIRLPSAFCGIYGLKPTCGRVSSRGIYPLCWSVGSTGPMAASVDDLALAYYVMAGKDPEDTNTYFQPSPSLYGFYMTNTLSDLRIGIFPAWNYQVKDSEISAALEEFKNAFQLRGAEFIEIDIRELEQARVGHLISIGSEVNSSMKRFKKEMHKISYPNRATHLVLDHITASVSTDLVFFQAQQVRTRVMEHLMSIFSDVNLILTPSSGITAPYIHPYALRHGELNSSVTADAMRFVSLANFTGIPAISVPAGYDAKGLPIGLQFIAKWYDEATLLRAAKVSEEILGSRRRKPSESRWFGDWL